MAAFRKSLYVILKRPVVLCFTGLITLLYCIIDLYNPLTRILMGFNSIGKGDIFESIVYSIQLLRSTVMNTKNFLTEIIIFLLFLIVVSAVLGVLLSGYFSIINKTIEGAPKAKGEFLEGIKKHSIRTSLVFLRVIFFGLMVFVVLLIASVPAVIVTRAWISGKAELTLVMAFLDILTLGVLFFGFVFFSTYVLYWFPAAINYDKRTFAVAKKTADSNFWRTVLHFLVFGIVYLFLHLILSFLNANVSEFISFPVKWLVRTMFFSIFAAFVFSSFKFSLKGYSSKKPSASFK